VARSDRPAGGGFLFLGAIEAWRDSPTFDEPVFVSSGLTALRTGELSLNDEHPPLAKVLAVLPGTPVLFQAGASATGRAFAARHAEVVFMIARDPTGAAAYVADVRARALGHARRGCDLIFLRGLWFVIGDTEEAARRREADVISASVGRAVVAPDRPAR
jgi:alkanesulfonate monooxygenase SsuD/methylene tetrahydromethanopterin reductase-like flavin-dependent oxidoreductase (luciferase family)